VALRGSPAFSVQKMKKEPTNTRFPLYTRPRNNGHRALNFNDTDYW
jgi:hypothetical protein